MKILWMSNAPWCKTGYGVQTRLVVRRLVGMGHEVACQAFYGLEGTKLNWDGIEIYPKAYHPYGMDAVEANADDFKADLVITLLDAWVLEPPLMKEVRWCPWFPIDCEPIPEQVRKVAAQSFQPLVFSKFGEQQARAARLEPLYIPHGVETNIYKPMERDEARMTLGWPKDTFVVGMVAANKGFPSRKAFPQQLEAFARFHKQRKDSLLYLHTSEGVYGEEGGVNLPSLAKALGIEQAVRFCDQYQNMLGFPDEYMAVVYNAMDVLLSVSMGEGFGIPILEAQSCGCPVIVGDWTSMPELCFGGYLVGKEQAEKWWTPLESWQFVPRVEAVEAALEAAYAESEDERKAMRLRARAGAMEYDADRVMEYWGEALGKIEERGKQVVKGVQGG